MTVRIPAWLAVLVAAAAAFAAGALSGRARAAESSGPVDLRIIAQGHSTEVFAFRYAGRDCVLGSTQAGASVSLQCFK